VLSELRLEAFASGPGNATADFLDTFAITKIQLFDSTGTLLDDNVTLTDASGGALPVSLSPQPPAVPEPSSALLLAAGLGILASALRRPRLEGGAYRRLRAAPRQAAVRLLERRLDHRRLFVRHARGGQPWE
jgi:hypothetical protein